MKSYSCEAEKYARKERRETLLTSASSLMVLIQVRAVHIWSTATYSGCTGPERCHRQMSIRSVHNHVDYETLLLSYKTFQSASHMWSTGFPRAFSFPLGRIIIVTAANGSSDWISAHSLALPLLRRRRVRASHESDPCCIHPRARPSLSLQSVP